jgi:hypothetical protein
MKDKKMKKYPFAAFLLAGASVLLGLLSFIPEFCNMYTEKVYCVISDVIGKWMDSISCPVGELLMYLGAILIFLFVLLWILFIFLQKYRTYRHFVIGYSKVLSIVALSVVFLYVINWLLPFRCSYITISEDASRTYTVEELQQLRNFITENMNEAAYAVERDENGRMIYSDDLEKDVADALRALSGEFSRLSGYYPKMKPAWCSDYLEWMYIGGYTYPYTMEITYNRYEHGLLYYPVLYAHESCHHQGYYQEDEADFLSYIACASSDNAYLRYSAYHEMYYLIDAEYFNALFESTDNDTAWTIYDAQPLPCELVYFDEKVNSEMLQSAIEEGMTAPEEFETTVNEIGDTGWDVQTNILQEKTYNGSVLLLLQYYEKNIGFQ